MHKNRARAPDVTFEIPGGVFHLTRTKKHQRIVEIRRRGSFGWTLGADNLLTREIEAKLGSDLAGSVALQLLGRASLTWEIASHVKLLHEPDDVEKLQRTPDLEEVAEQIAEALRGEIDETAIVAEAEERLDGPFASGSAYAVHIGRRTKRAPDQPERCFGRLAPLGLSSLQTVISWLGYVPARSLTDWPHFRFIGWSIRESPELSLEHPHADLWLQPEYRAANEAVEILAVTDGLRAAARAPDSVPAIALACEDVIVCRPLRIVFAPELRLVVPGGPDRPVTRPLPLEDEKVLAQALEGLGHPEAAGGLATGWWVLVPLSLSAFLRRLPENEAFLHALLWVADEEPDFPLDPWAYTDLNERGLPRWSEDIWYYELDTEGFTAAVAEAMREALPDLVREDEEPGLVASSQRAVSVLRHDLEPALRDYEGGELTALLEAARELREKLETVARDLLAERDEAENRSHADAL